MHVASSTRSRQILALALPATLSLAADPLLGLVDTALVGRLGTPELAGLGVATVVFTTAFVAFNVLTYGTTARVAQLTGAGRHDEAGRFVVQAVWASLGAGLLTTAVLVLGTGPILSAMGASGAVAGPAAAYLRVRAFAAVPVLLVQVGHGALRGLSDTRTPLLVTVVVNVVNAVGSWALIYPAGMGVAGAALGTVLAQAVAAAIFMRILSRRLPITSRRPDAVLLLDLGRFSRDLFLRTITLVLGMTLVTAAAARIDAQTVAAHQVARELWLLAALAIDGFAIAGQAMIGTALGRGDLEEARRTARALVGWGVLAGTVLTLVSLPLDGVLPRVFTNDPAVIEAIGAVWIVVALLHPLGAIAFVLDGILIGAGDVAYLFRSMLLAVVLGLVPLTLLTLDRGWGLRGLWAAIVALMVIRTAALLWRLRSDAWLHLGGEEP